MNEVAHLVQLANDRLRKGRVGITLEIRGRGEWLYIRGTFPPKPGSLSSTPYQQRIALKMRATPAAIKQAEATAKVVGGELNLGRFDWGKWSDTDDTPQTKTVEHWLSEFEEYWWRSRDRTDPSKQNTWDKAYRLTLLRLPKDKELTLELLIEWVTYNSEPGTRRRQQYCTCATALSKLAGLSVEPFKELSRGYGLKAVNPRSLPNDSEIMTIWQSIADPGWQYIYGLMAAYGLRNHECFGLDYVDFPVIRVRRTTKTGIRPVKPLYPEWVDYFQLQSPTLPVSMPPIEQLSNKQLGQKVTSFFSSYIPFSAYNLRHCYARRCAEFSIPPNVAAKLMGHSTKMHERVYQAWIGEKVFLDAADRAINREDRPKPPSLS